MSTADEHIPVLIIGGSMIGLTTALLLNQHGVPTLSVERHAGTAIHPRAAHFHLRTLEIFRSAGIEEEVRRASELRYYSDGGISAVDSLAGTELAKYIPSLNAGVELVSPSRRLFLTQEALEPILRDAALEHGATLRYGTELTDFTLIEDGVVATVRDVSSGSESRIHADYMVACDGWRSPIRERLGIGMRGHGLLSNSVTIYFRADLAPIVGDRTDGVIYVYNDELRGFFRLNKDNQAGFLVVNTVGDTSRPEATDLTGMTTGEALRLLRAAIGVPDLEIEVRDIAHWKAIADVADRYSDGRVLLAGDAAHVMPPNGGFGGNTGVQDAYNLAWKLAHVLSGQAGPELLATYTEERRPIGRLTIEQAYTRYVTRTAPYLGTNGMQPLVEDLKLEIGHRYRSSAVIEDAGLQDDGLPYVDPQMARGRPGTRAPHVWLGRSGGRISSLDLIRQRFVFLAGPDGEAWCEAARAATEQVGVSADIHLIGGDEIVDVEDAFLSSYDLAASGVVLVRPDGYVAWRAVDESASPEVVSRVLATLLSRSDVAVGA